MVRQRVASQAQLSQIEGVGDARVEKSGEALLQVMSVAAAARPMSLRWRV